MKIGYLTFLLTLFLGAAICSAQSSTAGSVDFTGRWVSESIKASSSLGDIPTTKGSLFLVVTHTNHEVRIKELSSAMGNAFREAVYYLDGRGEYNKGYKDGPVLDSKTQLKDGKLLINVTLMINDPNRKFRSKEEWALSKDGKKLTITTTTFSGAEVRNVKIYKRES